MTPVVLLATAVIIGACSGLNSKIDQEFDESENLIEPAKNGWIVTNKHKDKMSLLKNLIIAFQKFDSKKKIRNKEKEMALPFVSSTTESVDEKQTTQINEDNQDKTNDKDSANNHETVNYDWSHLDLAVQNEENKKYIHSIVNGWTF